MLDKFYIYNQTEEFLAYLKCNLSKQTIKFIDELSAFANVIIFSGILRNFFLKYKNSIRDLDLVIDCKDANQFNSLIETYRYKKNSFGGYKILMDDLNIDLWEINSTWAFTNNKVESLLFNEYNLPNTSFFNFSSIIFNYNKKQFVFSDSFIQFLESREIDLVLEENPSPQLCIVNSIYYKEKFNLNISSNLKKYYINHFLIYNAEQYLNIQIKHFNKELYSYEYLKVYFEIFKKQIKSLEPSSI